MKVLKSHPNSFWCVTFLALVGATPFFAPPHVMAVDTEPLNNSQLTADSLPHLLPGSAISNLAGLGGAGGDVDFFQAPMAAGEVLFGTVTPLAGLPASFTPPDTVVGVFDDTGELTFNEDDDAGELADIEKGYGLLLPFFLSACLASSRLRNSVIVDLAVALACACRVSGRFDDLRLEIDRWLRNDAHGIYCPLAQFLVRAHAGSSRICGISCFRARTNECDHDVLLFGRSYKPRRACIRRLMQIGTQCVPCS